jgi:hypothetical protein
MAVTAAMDMRVSVLWRDLSSGAEHRDMRRDVLMTGACSLNRMQAAVSQEGEGGIEQRQ